MRVRRLIRNLLRSAAAAAAACGFLAAVEAALAVAGFGHPTRLLVPAPDAPGRFDVNPAFALRFFPGPWLPEPAPEPVCMGCPGALDIAVFGESAAYGYPDPAFGFARMLELALAQMGQPAHVANLALSGIDSGAVREIALEALAHRPDLLVLYCGNNEFVGPHAPGRGRGESGARREFDRIFGRYRIRQALQGLRAGGDAPRAAAPDAAFGEPLAPDDPRIAAALQRYAANLEAVCDAAHARGVPVLLCTLPASERGFPPFASHAPPAEAEALHAALEAGRALQEAGDVAGALAAFERAPQRGAGHAAIAYHTAQCLEALGRNGDALEAYRRAVECDARRMRAGEAIHAAIAAVAEPRAARGVALVDCRAAFRAASPHGVVGGELMYDHCHPNFAGHLRIASALLDALRAMGLAPRGGDALPAAGAAIGFTPWHAREALAYILRAAQRPLYAARDGHAAWRAALEARMRALDLEGAADAAMPAMAAGARDAAAASDGYYAWRIAGQLAGAAGDGAGALEAFRRAAACAPRHAPAHLALGRALAPHDRDTAIGEYRAAAELLPEQVETHAELAALIEARDGPAAALESRRRAADLDPHRVESWRALAQTCEAAGDLAQAIAAYERALEYNPDHPGLLYYLARLCLKRGDLARAREAARRGLAALPGDPGLQRLSAEIDAAR